MASAAEPFCHKGTVPVLGSELSDHGAGCFRQIITRHLRVGLWYGDVTTKGWRDGSAIKSTCCSSGGPESCTGWLSTACNSNLRGFAPSSGLHGHPNTCAVHSYRQIHKNRKFKFSKETKYRIPESEETEMMRLKRGRNALFPAPPEPASVMLS